MGRVVCWIRTYPWRRVWSDAAVTESCPGSVPTVRVPCATFRSVKVPSVPQFLPCLITSISRTLPCYSRPLHGSHSGGHTPTSYRPASYCFTPRDSHSAGGSGGIPSSNECTAHAFGPLRRRAGDSPEGTASESPRAVQDSRLVCMRAQWEPCGAVWLWLCRVSALVLH